MTLYYKLFLAGYFLAVMIVQAFWQKALFNRDITINHTKHGIYYTITVLPALYMLWPAWWQVPLIAWTERIALFDPLLNLIRGKLPLLTYNGRGTTGSKIDQWENRFSVLWLTVLKLVYIVVFILTLIFIK